MSKEMERVRDEHMMAAIALLVTAGHTIEQSDVRIARLSESEFEVSSVILYEVFQDVRSAVAYYLDLCDPT